MSLKLNLVETNEDIIKFLLNPFETNCLYKDKILQKYQQTETTDVVYTLETDYKYYYILAIINYESNTIYLNKDSKLPKSITSEAPFVKISDLQKNFISKAKEMLEAYEISEKNKIEEHAEFKKTYNKFKADKMQALIHEAIGTSGSYYKKGSRTYNEINDAAKKLSIEELILFENGNLDKVKAAVNANLYNSDYLKVLAVEKVLQEVKDYMEKGVFTESELLLSDYLKKTKDSGAERFTVHTVFGSKYMCRNNVSSKLQVYPTSDHGAISLENIESVTYKGKTLYKKGVK